MNLFATPEEHAANPPQSWQVVKAAPRLWHLQTTGGTTLDSFTTRHAAETARDQSWLVTLYEEERRWYAGERVNGRRPWADVLADRKRIDSMR